MWIVKLALNRPYTTIVLAIMICVLGGVAIFQMPTDIFPDINIPVASVFWAYNGLSPDDMAKRVVTAHVPLRNMFGYSTRLRSLSEGRATFSMQFQAYDTLQSA